MSSGSCSRVIFGMTSSPSGPRKGNERLWKRIKVGLKCLDERGGGPDAVLWAVPMILGLYFVGVVLIQGRLTLQNRMFYWNNESVQLINVLLRLSFTRALWLTSPSTFSVLSLMEKLRTGKLSAAHEAKTSGKHEPPGLLGVLAVCQTSSLEKTPSSFPPTGCLFSDIRPSEPVPPKTTNWQIWPLSDSVSSQNVKKKEKRKNKNKILRENSA